MTRGPLATGPLPRTPRKRRNNPALPGVDGRSSASVRFRNIVAAFAADLGHEATTSELAIVRQAALNLILVEQLQAKALNNGATVAELGEIARLENVIVRCLVSLGLRGRKRVDGQSLAQFIAAREVTP